MEKLPLSKAITAGLRKAMEDDPKVVLIGEDIGKLGGVFRVTEGLQKDFGPQRVIDAPLAESGIVGTSIGMAIRGYRPVVEIQFDAFIFPAYDQIVTQVAKLYNRTLGNERIPMVIRVPYGGGIGSPEHHSESPEAVFAHHAGLKLISPSTANDAYWMIQEAIKSDDPVMFFEPKRRYWQRGDVDTTRHDLGMLEARVLSEGTDVTLVTYGPLVPTALDVVAAAAEEGKSVELIDLRSLNPLDLSTIERSVVKTGRLVVTHEAPTFLGLGSEIAARISERCFFNLEAPVIRVGGYHTPYPGSRMEEHYLPDLDRIFDGVDRALAY
ncbi:pyruvate dehydrogenase E1 component subunit beta [Mycobacteroides abscessus subsp. abscessus]|uniref:3-methyl-2-oxobutanoate dehydrogenase (2-methylpropanoyl-transferring) n=3 Tax=Brevibacterium casei TaxID=33889 RepID=K9B3E0_9MICO|nr:alpha-ketoacid dehydrogenase subunit beta [Brevibacterium casei]NJE66290.1 alpha-ketoacid dehydrogenase subunit beta [Brevibacterium sp. LS14]SIG89637.1 pyruvate dehydrogenase E1 component subunit beta [Mycobacteroides abscessus subsp. abscessus]EKU48290.1 branched-chain alpha-keto acid dehydrogenase E1 subunit beta [Brevibacterium casei S18]MDH5148099.1 alpha-ketoacid dehydrogenase subunit beta [Brevibacterium casei]PAK96772.1 alpha-ketoacid dehydrogenase subunit beta [Brevibacterium casei